jgi:5-hydroxyisourate hydrolase-like protein (transthyretin family)
MEDVKSEGCGPGCSCGKPPENKKAKVAICMVVLLAICGIFVYKAMSAKQSAPAITEAAFAAPILNQATGQEPAVKVVVDTKQVGEFIDSLASLNTVAANQDAVFVFVPASDNEIVSKETLNAIVSAEQKLKSSDIKLGLYTLRFSPSKEYASIASQLTLPAVLVMSKGKGMGTVSGEITETTILQAYVASSRAGGCGPSSSCSPSTPGCGPSAPALGPRR